MRRCLIISALLLAACGREAVAPPPVALLDLRPCPGWTGPRPSTEGAFARAAAAERAGRLCANSKLASVSAAVGTR